MGVFHDSSSHSTVYTLPPSLAVSCLYNGYEVWNHYFISCQICSLQLWHDFQLNIKSKQITFSNYWMASLHLLDGFKSINNTATLPLENHKILYHLKLLTLISDNHLLGVWQQISKNFSDYHKYITLSVLNGIWSTFNPTEALYTGLSVWVSEVHKLPDQHFVILEWVLV